MASVERSARSFDGVANSLFENSVLYRRVERQVNANKGFSMFSIVFGHTNGRRTRLAREFF
jgi:hypothetical protein